MTNSAQRRVASVARVIGCSGWLPCVRIVTPEQMRAASADPLMPASSMIYNRDKSGDLWVTEEVGDGTLVHELTHHLLKTSPVAATYPHPGSDVDGHGALFAALCWALLGRAHVPLEDGPGDYDLGRCRRPGDRPATQEEERWARRWVGHAASITGSAESLAAVAICDYRRWWRWRRACKGLAGPLRLALAVAALLAAPAGLAAAVRFVTALRWRY